MRLLSILVLCLLPVTGYAQGSQIQQPIVVNGQITSGFYVSVAGQMQSYTCPTPQRYTTLDGSAQGWACYEQSTGAWLLGALPPQPAPVVVVPQPVYQPVMVVYQQESPRVAPTVVLVPVSPSVILGQAAIETAGRVAEAVIWSTSPRRGREKGRR